MCMSITPREPPSEVNSDAGEPTGGQAGSTRVAYGCWRATVAVVQWVWNRLGSLVERLRSGDGDSGRDAGPGLQRGPVAAFDTDGSDDRTDGPAELPGESGPGLPPRPDLEAEKTESGLELRRPGREEAYVTSDEWREVRR